MTSPWAPRLAGRIRAAEDQVKCTSVCGRARSAVAERTTTAGIWPSVTTRGAVRGSSSAGRIVVGARACNACSGTPRCAVVTSAAFACWLTTSMSMTVRIFGVRHRGCASWSALGKCKDWRDAGFAVRGHRSPAQGRSLPCRYVRSPEVTSGLAATFDHRTYRSAPVPECTDSPPAADELFPRSGPLTTWILMCHWKRLPADAGTPAGVQWKATTRRGTEVVVTGAPRKRLVGKPARGFESHPLRQIPHSLHLVERVGFRRCAARAAPGTNPCSFSPPNSAFAPFGGEGGIQALRGSRRFGHESLALSMLAGAGLAGSVSRSGAGAARERGGRDRVRGRGPGRLEVVRNGAPGTGPRGRAPRRRHRH